MLDAATVGVRDEGVRGAITSTLADDNLNKRVAWMNRVLGSLYVDDGMVEEEEGKADAGLCPSCEHQEWPSDGE